VIVIQDIAQFNAAVDDLLRQEYIGFDIETTGLDPYQDVLTLMSFATPAQSYVLDVQRAPALWLSTIGHVLDNPSITKVIHNAIFDCKFVRHHLGVIVHNVHCTQITEQLIKAGLLSSGFGLDDVAARRLGVAMDKSIRKQFIGKALGTAFSAEELRYSAQDAVVLIGIYQQQMEEVRTERLDRVYRLEMDLIPVTVDMEYQGVCVNEPKMRAALPVIDAVVANADRRLQDICLDNGAAEYVLFQRGGYSVLNSASPKQVLAAFSAMGIDVPSLNRKDLTDWDSQWQEQEAKKQARAEARAEKARDKATTTMPHKGSRKAQDAREGAGPSPSTPLVDSGIVIPPIPVDMPAEPIHHGDADEDFAVGFAHPTLRQHAIRTAAAKLSGTYITGLLSAINPVTGRIHPGFRQCGAVATGRFSSTKPNAQTMPNATKLSALGLAEWDIRSMLVAAPGRKFIICAKGDSRVATSRGYIQIKDVVVGDAVLQEDGSAREVLRHIPNGVRSVQTVQARNGMSITVTPQHRLRVVDEAGEYVWRKAEDIQVGDYVAVQTTALCGTTQSARPIAQSPHHNSLPIQLPSVLSSEVAEFIGYLVGDGHMVYNGTHWVVAAKDPELSTYLCARAGGLFGEERVHYRGTYRGVSDHAIYSTTLADWLVENDVAREKDHIPEFVWRSSPNEAAAFLRGLFEADGSVSWHRTAVAISVASSRLRLMEDVQRLLLALGIHSTLRTVYPYKGKYTAYTVNILEHSNRVFVQRVGFMSERKRTIAARALHKTHKKSSSRTFPYRVSTDALSRSGRHITRNVRNIVGRTPTFDMLTQLDPEDLALLPSAVTQLCRNGQLYSKVVANVVADPVDVYDLTIEGTSTYIANGFVNHNCDFAGIELVILAALSGDQNLLDQILHGDIHTYVANSLYGDQIERALGSLITPENKGLKGQPWKATRDLFKPVSYGTIYGSTGWNLYRTVGLPMAALGMHLTQDECERWVQMWKHELFPGTGTLLDKNAADAVTKGYTESALGRRRHWDLRAIRAQKWMYTAAMREGMNAPIQSASADMTKLAMVNVHSRLQPRWARIVLTVHDELVVEAEDAYVEEAAAVTKSGMEAAGYQLFPHLPMGAVTAEPKISLKYDK
jgi:DNA polymerase I-like protein with 3'-5' exonuclease and polymerase domains/intein/homing endonuclease